MINLIELEAVDLDNACFISMSEEPSLKLALDLLVHSFENLQLGLKDPNWHLKCKSEHLDAMSLNSL